MFNNAGIRIDIPNLEAAIRELTKPLKDMPKLCEQAASLAINRALYAMRVEAIRIARREYSYVPAQVFDQLYMNKAQKTHLEGSLYISDEVGINLYHFRPTPKLPGGNRPAAGVSAQIRRSGQRKVYQPYSGYSRPFIMAKRHGTSLDSFGVFVRKEGATTYRKKGNSAYEGRVWKGFEMLFGASPIQALEKKENQDKISDKGGEIFRKRLQHEIDFQLSKLMGAK